jgi:energy-coupling factor transporter ATP-binding protein EcfA2
MTSFAGLEIMSDDDQPDYGKWLIHGPQGSGKTTLASTLANFGKTLFIDMVGEQGRQSYKGAPWAGNIDPVRPQSVTQLDDIFWKLASGDHPYDCVVVDSITSVQKLAMRFILGHDETAVKEIRKGTAPATIQSWGQTLDIMTDMATYWYSLADASRKKPMHVAMTAQTKYIQSEDNPKEKERVPDVQKGALSITLAAPAYILYTDVEDNVEHYSDESLPPTTHIVRFGNDPDYRIKARVPYNLRGRIPPVLGRKKQTTLSDLSKVLGIGGVETLTKAA